MALRHPIRWLREHPVHADTLLAVMLSAVAVAMHWTTSDEVEGAVDPSWWGTILVIAAVLPVAARRISPIPVALGVVAVQVFDELLVVQGSGWVGVMVAVYSLGAHTGGRRRTNATIGVAVIVSVLLVAGVVVDQIGPGALISTAVVLTTAFVLGDNLQRRRQHVSDLAERAERAERERDLLAREKVSEERTRIARELHDVVAHSVSVMVIQAGAARRTVATDPDGAASALSTIEQTGRDAMNELRRILGVLRHEADAERAPQPGIATLSDLTGKELDLPVHLDVTGDLDALPTAVELASYRVVQEALTNVRRHAGPVRRVDVKVARQNGHVVIDVIDDGRGAAADQSDPGFGLLGMRERVATCGGTLSAGPVSGGGWKVHAELPVEVHP